MKKDVKKIMWNCKASAPPSANFFLCNFVFFLPQDDGNVLVWMEGKCDKECVVSSVVVMERAMWLYNNCMVSGGEETANFHASKGCLKTWNRCTCTVWIEGGNQHLLPCGWLYPDAFRIIEKDCLSQKILMAHVHFCKKCNHDKTCPGFKVSKDFINLLLCFYAPGGCILACMLICVSLISQGLKRKIKSCLPLFGLWLEGLGCEAVIAGLVQHLPC